MATTNFSGALNVTDALIVGGTANITGAVALQGGLALTGVLTHTAGTINAGVLTTSGTVNVAGALTAGAGLNLTGALTNTGGTISTGALIASGTASVAGTATFGNPTDYSRFEANGVLAMGGSACVWDDMITPAQGINPPGLASDPAFDTTEYAWNFTGDAVKMLAGVVQLSHQYKEGSGIVPHLHGYAGGTSAAPNNVSAWQMRYRWVNVSGTAQPATWGTLSANHTHIGIARQMEIVSFGTVSGTWRTVSSLFKWELSRMGTATADTLAENFYLDSIDVHYQKDTLGSRQELAK